VSPDFSGRFFWKPSDMLALFDSIYKGYPIGSLLLWESPQKVETLDSLGPIQSPPPKSPLVAYILDGHQRLATLFGGLRIPKDAPLGAKQQNWRWWIWFDLKNKEFVHVTRNEPEPWLLPLRSVSRTMDFLEAARSLQKECPDKALEFVEEAEYLAQKMKNYKVAVNRIKGGNMTQAVEIFSRLNNLGRQITPDQMVSALIYREDRDGLNLARRIDKISDSLSQYHFGNINRQTLFRAIVAVANRDIYNSDWEDVVKKLGSEQRQAVDDTEKSLLAAARFLCESLGVPGSCLLPYTHQLLMLSLFFHHCPKPDENQTKVLTRWFWNTSLSGWFAGTHISKVNRALDEMRDFARDGAKKFRMMNTDAPARAFPNRFDRRSARVRSLLIFMVSLEPLDLTDGKSVKAEQIFQIRGYRLPYIFSHAEGGLVSNPANRILLERSTGESVREQLLSIDPKIRQQVLDSHGINCEAYESLKQGDADAFIMKRAEHLEQLERDFMTSLGIPPATEPGFGEADIDTDED